MVGVQMFELHIGVVHVGGVADGGGGGGCGDGVVVAAGVLLLLHNVVVTFTHRRNMPTASTCPPLPCQRWNPHLPPSFPPSATGASSDFRVISLDDPSAGRGSQLRTLGHATLPRSCGLSLGHVNYLAVDYALGEVRPTRKPRGDEEEAASGKEARPSARLRVFVNDPGRLGSAVLSVAVDLWALIEMGG